MREAWITKDGKVHEGKNHFMIAHKLFPYTNNPEFACERAGYIKTGYRYDGSPMMENYNPERATQAQINTVARLWEEHYKDCRKRNLSSKQKKD